MKEYQVFFLPEADAEIKDSYEWGVVHWGPDQAEKWIRQLYQLVFKRLRSFPESCSLAPESAESDEEIRHFIIGRYRVTFHNRWGSRHSTSACRIV
ncbi:MAG: type II toxin-antitoxin system RelE/ParE family toxin [Pyrinomonadaceae bacterium]